MAANPYLDDSVNNVLGDIVRNYSLAVQPSFNNAMVRSGSFGNSGLQQMNNEAQRQLQTSLGRAATDLRYQDHWNDLNFNRQIFNDAYAQNMGNLQAGMGLLSFLNQSNQGDLGNQTNLQNTPLSYWQQFTNQATGIGSGFGTQTNSTQMQGNPLLGAVGGAQLGSAMGKSWGGGWGSGSGGWGPSANPNDYSLPSSFDQFRVG